MEPRSYHPSFQSAIQPRKIFEGRGRVEISRSSPEQCRGRSWIRQPVHRLLPKAILFCQGHLQPQPHQLRITVIARHAAFELDSADMPYCVSHTNPNLSVARLSRATLVFRAIGWTPGGSVALRGFVLRNVIILTRPFLRATHRYAMTLLSPLGILTTSWIDVGDQNGRAG